MYKGREKDINKKLKKMNEEIFYIKIEENKIKLGGLISKYRKKSKVNKLEEKNIELVSYSNSDNYIEPNDKIDLNK